MKKVEILKPFRDKLHFNTAYTPGEVKEFDNDRAANLIARGLAKDLDNEEEEKPITPKGKGKGKKNAKGNAPTKDANPTAEEKEAEDNEADDANPDDGEEKEAETDTDKE